MIIKNDKKICGCLIVIAYTEHADRISELWYGLIHVHVSTRKILNYLLLMDEPDQHICFKCLSLGPAPQGAPRLMGALRFEHLVIKRKKKRKLEK